MGMFLELLRKWAIIIAIISLFVIRLVIPAMPIAIPLIFLTALLAFATIKQLKHRKTILNMNLNEDANELLDKMFADNKKGYRNVIDTVNEIIEENKNNPDS